MAERLLWPELAPAEVADGWLAELDTLVKVTSADVLDAVSRRHEMSGFNGAPGRWVFVREVQAATGSYSDVQRFDAVAVGLVPSVKYARVVYEVKVSRSDWLRELRPLLVDPLDGHRYHQVRKAHRDELIANVDWRVVEQAKWAAALAVSTEMWFAAPPRCILPSEVPEGTGLVEVRPWGKAREMRAKVVVPAPVRETPQPGPEFWAAVLRRAARRA